jgi:hypothetical protein
VFRKRLAKVGALAGGCEVKSESTRERKRRSLASYCAGMAELVDARDLKSITTFPQLFWKQLNTCAFNERYIKPTNHHTPPLDTTRYIFRYSDPGCNRHSIRSQSAPDLPAPKDGLPGGSGGGSHGTPRGARASLAAAWKSRAPSTPQVFCSRSLRCGFPSLAATPANDLAAVKGNARADRWRITSKSLEIPDRLRSESGLGV